MLVGWKLHEYLFAWVYSNSSVERYTFVYCVDVWCFTVAVSGIIEVRLLIGCLQFYLSETSGNEHNRFELCWFDFICPNSQVYNRNLQNGFNTMSLNHWNLFRIQIALKCSYSSYCEIINFIKDRGLIFD